jgi:hypothetical protein
VVTPYCNTPYLGHPISLLPEWLGPNPQALCASPFTTVVSNVTAVTFHHKQRIVDVRIGMCGVGGKGALLFRLMRRNPSPPVEVWSFPIRTARDQSNSNQGRCLAPALSSTGIYPVQDCNFPMARAGKLPWVDLGWGFVAWRISPLGAQGRTTGDCKSVAWSSSVTYDNLAI